MIKSTGKWLALALACTLVFSSCKKTQDVIPTSANTSSTLAPEQQGGSYVSNQYIVLYHSSSEPATKATAAQSYSDKVTALQQGSAALLAQYGVAPSAIKQSYVIGVQGIAVTLNEEQLTKLKSDPNIQAIEPDQVIKLDVSPGKTTEDSSGQTIPWGVARVGYGPAVGKTVWIIDSGVDMTHPDLTVDATRCKSFLGDSTSAQDQNGHGTHVAGIIAANNNSIGVVGVAAGATVVALRTLDANGMGTMSNIIAAVDWVAGHAKQGDVVNLSVGGLASGSLDGAVYLTSTLGIFFAIASGNQASSATDYSPARVNGENIYTVAAMDVNDMWASFSNYGMPPIDYCTPGVNIYSAYLNGGYATLTGTSMAAPHMAGLLLLDGRNITTSGTVKGDPTGAADPIPHRASVGVIGG